MALIIDPLGRQSFGSGTRRQSQRRSLAPTDDRAPAEQTDTHLVDRDVDDIARAKKVGRTPPDVL
jgi:hypothetical protein